MISFRSVFSAVCVVAHGLLGVVKPVVVFIGRDVDCLGDVDVNFDSDCDKLAATLRDTDRPLTVVHSFPLGVLASSSSSRSCGFMTGDCGPTPNPLGVAPSDEASSSISNNRSLAEDFGRSAGLGPGDTWPALFAEERR